MSKLNFNLSGKIAVLFCSLMMSLSCSRIAFRESEVDQSIISQNGMVVSAQALASEVGIHILKKGGNAVDAAVASQFAQAVAYPRAGNLGGGGFMVIRTADGEFHCLDYREKAPYAAHKDMYLNALGEVIDSASTFGSLSAGVPGSVDGLITAWEKFGRIRDFREIIDPAILLAYRGFAVSEEEADRLNQYSTDFKKFNAFPNPFVKGQPWKRGDILRQKDLAHTLKLIREHGSSGFYSGKTADRILETMKISGGIIQMEDLLNYRSVWREPVQFDYKNYKIVSMPPPSSGGIALAQLMKLTEEFDIQNMGFQTKESIHLMVEAERRVYEDRAKYLGDSDFFDVPASILLDTTYLQQKMLDFDPEKASPVKGMGKMKSIDRESFETTHTSVVDKDRMAVSVTTTLNSNYGSKVLVRGAGFFLNNEMDDFSVKPGVPNQFGLIGSEANAIQPGKRMLSSMTPTIVEKDGNLFMVVGSPGGSTIITTVFQVILNVIDFGLPLDEAVNAPRFHHQYLPDRIFIEKNRMDPLVIEQLKQMGHTFGEYERIGLVKAIRVLPDGRLHGVGDNRSDVDVEAY